MNSAPQPRQRVPGFFAARESLARAFVAAFVAAFDPDGVRTTFRMGAAALSRDPPEATMGELARAACATFAN